MRGVIYSITLTILMLFVTIFVSSLISSYEKVNGIFYDFITDKKGVDDYAAIKYSLNTILGVTGSHGVNVSFPFTSSSTTIGKDLNVFTQFLNTTYATNRFSRIVVNASELISIVNSGALAYEIVPYNVVVEKQPGAAEKIVISNLTNLKGLYVKIESDAIVESNYWKPPGYTPGVFNFTFNEIGVPLNYFISNSSNADYVLELEKNGTNVGDVVISFEFNQNRIKIEERNVDFDEIDYLRFSLNLFFQGSSTITTIPIVLVSISDYLNKTIIESFI